MDDFLDAVSNFILDIKSENDDSSLKEAIKELLSYKGSITKNFRDDTEGNFYLRRYLLFFALVTVEAKYGKMSLNFNHENLYINFELSNARSKLGFKIDNNSELIVVIDGKVEKWEDLFYEICHETVHILNPLKIPVGKSEGGSALDEGVAVKFAEEIFNKYIKSYYKYPSRNSPIRQDIMYKKAYDAAVKVPDEVLKVIRESFGAFGTISDIDKFRCLTKDYLTESDICLLSSNFVYEL